MRLTQPPLSYIPLLPILTGVVAGVLFGRYVAVDTGVAVAVMVIVGLAAIGLRRSWVAELLLPMALAVVSVSQAMPVQFKVAPGRETTLEGTVTRVEVKTVGQSADVVVGGHAEGDFTVRITYPLFVPALEVGDKIRFSGTYSLPRRSTDIPLEDDLSEFYFNTRISLLCYVPQDCLEVAGRSGNPLFALQRLRGEIVDRIYSSGLSEQAAVFLAAVLTGDTAALTPERRQQYASAGVAHILALSGAHVAVIAVVVSLLLFPLVVAGHRKLRWWLTIGVLWAYAVLTGMSPSVCRAVIMASAVLLALIFDRPRSSLNALCLAAILILVFSPLSLFNAGFQLSFVATLCIILFSPRLMPQGVARSRWRALWSLAAVTLAATLGTFPLVAWHFHSVPLFFFVANIAAVAVMPLMIGGGVLLTALLLLGVEPAWLVNCLDAVYGAFDSVVRLVAGLPAAAVDGIYIDGWLMVPMYAALAFFGLYLYRRRWNYAVLAVATALFTVGVGAAVRPVYADGEAYMLRSLSATAVAQHRGDTLRVLTASARHEYAYDSLTIADRYRDYIATRGIHCIEMLPLDSVSAQSGGTIEFGSRHMRVVSRAKDKDKKPIDTDTIDVNTDSPVVDYCLVTAKWYGDPVALYRSVNADTIVLSNDINRRRRQRYHRELTAAGIPAIDLAEQPLSSTR